jgi:hypothetical protein
LILFAMTLVFMGISVKKYKIRLEWNESLERAF